MSNRREIEDRFTVRCKRCEYEVIDPNRKPGQKYILRRPCPNCLYVHKPLRDSERR